MLPEPSLQRVKDEIDAFDNEEELVEKTVGDLFSLYPSNRAKHQVLAKAVVLNQLYNARVLDMHILGLTERIATSNIDQLLDAGVADVVTRICACCDARRYYSFATKYCSWHKPALYCMWDGNVDEALWFYEKRYGFSKFKRYELCADYEVLRSIVRDFQAYFGLDSLNFKNVDKFLWRMGDLLIKGDANTATGTETDIST